MSPIQLTSYVQALRQIHTSHTHKTNYQHCCHCWAADEAIYTITRLPSRSWHQTGLISLCYAYCRPPTPGVPICQLVLSVLSTTHPPHVPLVSLTLSAVLKNSTDLSADLFFVLFSLIFLFVSCGRLSYTSAFYCMLNTGYRIVSYHMKVSFLSMIGDSNHTMLYIFVNDR